ncbi:MAG: hypothetical protein ACPGTQ_11010, partial [Colwellia sp.]
RDDKRGAIPPDVLPLFERFNVNEDDWLLVVTEFNRHYISAAGCIEKMNNWANATNRKWCATHQGLNLYSGHLGGN